MADALQLPCDQPGSLSVSGLWRNVNVLSEILLARPPMKISVLLLFLLFAAATFAQAGNYTLPTAVRAGFRELI